MKSFKEFTESESLEEAQKNFNGKEHKKIVDGAVDHLTKGLNMLTISNKYLKDTGQGGAVGAFDKQYKVKKLSDIIATLNKYSDS